MKPAVEEQPLPQPKRVVVLPQGQGLVPQLVLLALPALSAPALSAPGLEAVCNQPLRGSALPQSTASTPMWVVRGFLPLRCLAIFCLNKFMPWINIVCELNCLLGKKGGSEQDFKKSGVKSVFRTRVCR